jgi:hypothetical protein
MDVSSREVEDQVRLHEQMSLKNGVNQAGRVPEDESKI